MDAVWQYWRTVGIDVKPVTHSLATHLKVVYKKEAFGIIAWAGGYGPDLLSLGKEFGGDLLRSWRPTDNGYIESFKGRFPIIINGLARRVKKSVLFQNA